METPDPNENRFDLYIAPRRWFGDNDEETIDWAPWIIATTWERAHEVGDTLSQQDYHVQMRDRYTKEVYVRWGATTPPPEGRELMFLGWYDPTKKKNIDTKIDEGLIRYQEKFGESPEIVMMNPDDFKVLEDRYPRSVPIVQFRGMQIETVSFIPRNTFYVGKSESVE